MIFYEGYPAVLEIMRVEEPIWLDRVYRQQYLQGQPIADIAKQYDWSLSDTAKWMQEEAVKAHDRRIEMELERESHWWYRLWAFFTGG